jgi:hypothetical protein
MKSNRKTLRCAALLCALSSAALAQQAPPPAPKATAQSEAGEPQADTSIAPSSAPQAAASAPAPAPAPAGRTTAPGRNAAATPPASSKAASKVDRLNLGTATVTGDREQPKVMYIVPWKRSDIGDLTGKPMNSLVDEVLAPVDRDVFKREVVYYHAVQAEATQNGAPPKPAQQGEK